MKLRESNIEKLEQGTFDALIVGGGINGAVAAASLSGKGAKVALIEQRDLLGRFPQPLPPGDSGRLADSYELMLEADDRVAGLEAQVVTLRPRDTMRYARRL